MIKDLIKHKQDGMNAYVKKACQALGINVPILRWKIADDGDLILYLYGGRVERWREGAKDLPPDPLPKGKGNAEKVTTLPTEEVQIRDDFSIIPGVGPVTAGKIRSAGVFTFAMLRQAWPVWLKQELSRVLTAQNIQAIETYLEEEKQ